MDKLERCPVIVFVGSVEEGSEDGTDRCNEPVAVRSHQAKDDEGYLGKIRVFAECMAGHSISEMEHDINLDLDGVPINA